ncbi:MAG: OsmC family protein [Actinomycetota bacterium]
MAQTKVTLRNLSGASTALGWSGSRSLCIDRSESAGGLGVGFNGGELLLLAVGGCYFNDLFREAAKMGIEVDKVSIEVEADWAGEPLRATNLSFSVKVESPASRSRIEELILHTDRVAEIPNSLRYGTEVKLRSFEAIST